MEQRRRAGAIMGKILNLHFTDAEIKALKAVAPLYTTGMSPVTFKKLIYDRLEDEYDLEIIRDYEEEKANGTLKLIPFEEVLAGLKNV